jgi:uncharacterized membrane protein YbhN (UPF0104 family)
MEYGIYHLPRNFTDAGRLLGLFEIRNMVETVVLVVPVLFLCLYFLPFALTPKIIVTLTLIVPLGGFGLIGVSDDSLSRWLSSWWRWRKSRRILAYRGEITQ